jgi:hypothetical protein
MRWYHCKMLETILLFGTTGFSRLRGRTESHRSRRGGGFCHKESRSHSERRPLSPRDIMAQQPLRCADTKGTTAVSPARRLWIIKFTLNTKQDSYRECTLSYTMISAEASERLLRTLLLLKTKSVRWFRYERNRPREGSTLRHAVAELQQAFRLKSLIFVSPCSIVLMLDMQSTRKPTNAKRRRGAQRMLS